MKKRLLALALASLMVLALLAGCGGGSTPAASGAGSAAGSSTPSGDAGLKIGLALPARDQFQTSMESAAQAYADANGIQMDVTDANNDISAQIGYVQTWAAGGYDAAIVVLCNNDSAAEVLSAAGDMPVVFVNRMPTDLSLLNGETVAYVGSNEADSGTFQGEWAAAYAKENNLDTLNVVQFQGPLGQDSVVKRTEYAKAAIEAAGITVNYVFNDTAEWDRSKAMDKFTQFVGSGQPYDIVISNNDDMALGVIESFTAAGITEIPVPILGIDATATGCEAIKAGTMAFTVFQDPVGQGEGAIKTAVAFANGESVETDEGVVWVPFIPVDSSNVDDYM